MKITIVQADRTSDKEIKALADLDVRIFPHKADLFNEQDWQYFRKLFEFFWILADGVIAGSIHLGLNLEWEEDLPSISYGCLYVASSGILPEFRNKGIGTFAKKWQIDYGKSHNFKRIVASTRKSNSEMIKIN